MQSLPEHWPIGLYWPYWPLERCSNFGNVVAFSHMPQFFSPFHLVLAALSCFPSSFLALAKETEGPDSPGELKHLELLVPTAASAGTNQVLRLHGADARQQLLVTANFSTGAVRDYTREVTYQAS